MQKIVAVILSVSSLCFVLVGCAAPKLDTPSGRPEVTIGGATAQQVRNSLTGRMIGSGCQLIRETGTTITFGKTMEGVGGALYQSLTVGAYGKRPVAEIDFTTVDVPVGVRVFAASFIQTQNAFGATQRNSLSNNAKENRGLQNILESVKNELDKPGQAYRPSAGNVWFP